MQSITTTDGIELAYHHTPGATPGIVFFGGYRSDMTGSKAMALEAHSKAQGRQFTRFDYRGHGQSGGDFIESTLTHWRDDALNIIDHVTKGEQIVVGSSMGGHVMLLAALARPEKIRGLIGIAAAADFTEKLMWERGDEARKQELLEKGAVHLPSDYSDEPYTITLKLIEDGRNHLLLDADIPLDLPVTLLHGQRDIDVPWEHSMLLARQIQSSEVDVIIRKDADHRFSREGDIALLCECVDKMLAQITAA